MQPDESDTDALGPESPDEIAYYYPEPYWLINEGGWIKSLLLFFDEVAILLPNYMYGRHVSADPTLAGPLEDKGLLRILQPEWFLDERTTDQLTEIVTALIEGGAFDDLQAGSALAELSISRFSSAPTDVARQVLDKLKSRGLAIDTEDGVSIPMHRVVRAVYLVALAQLARETGERHGLDLHPVTNAPATIESFRGFLELPSTPSRGNVIAFDLEEVSVDLNQVPLDEVLQFRNENRDPHRQYMKNLRRFALELSLADPADRPRLLLDRRAEIREQAHDLHQRALSAWKQPKDVVGFGFGLMGAAWSIATHNPVPAALAALGAIMKMLPAGASGSAYSYLFSAKQSLR